MSPPCITPSPHLAVSPEYPDLAAAGLGRRGGHPVLFSRLAGGNLSFVVPVCSHTGSSSQVGECLPYNLLHLPCTAGASLPGALGTENCDCDAIYGETDSAIACKVCNILQVSQICNTTQALDDTSYSCTAPVLLKAGKGKISDPDFYGNCGLSGESFCVKLTICHAEPCHLQQRGQRQVHCCR